MNFRKIWFNLENANLCMYNCKLMIYQSTPNVNSYKLVGYIGYHSKTEKFCLLPLTKMFVDDKECK